MRGFVVVVLLGVLGCGSDSADLFAETDSETDAGWSSSKEDAGLEDASAEDAGVIRDSGNGDAGIEEDASDADDAPACLDRCPNPDEWEQPCCLAGSVKCSGPAKQDPKKMCNYHCSNGQWDMDETEQFICQFLE